tara:strand:- start:22 stop:213 length:192 start_codon:yes stop_codon:yes gene_type:complete
MTGWIKQPVLNWLRRSNHFLAGRLEHPGGLLAQSNRLVQASAIIESERNLLEIKDIQKMKKKG